MDSDSYRAEYSEISRQVRSNVSKIRGIINLGDLEKAKNMMLKTYRIIADYEQLFSEHGDKMERGLTDGLWKHVKRVEDLVEDFDNLKNKCFNLK